MKTKFLVLISCKFVMCFNLAAQQQVWSLPTPEAAKLSTALIPYPSSVKREAGEVIFSTIKADMHTLNKVSDREQIARELADVCSFWNMPYQTSKNVLHVYFEQLPAESDVLKKESYTLVVDKKKIIISAADFAGYFNALQTLRQLVKEAADTFVLPICTIKDTPAFSMRGVMLDVGRNFTATPFIKDMMRRLSYYKVNVLHLHLTDDPGWRVEVKGMPELTAPSAYWKTRQPGKYYTQDELVDLIRYCADLNIRVIPEIDMPGHSAYFKKATGYSMQTPEGMTYLKKALDEVIPLFNDSLFHIGSDEVHFAMKDFMPEMIEYVRNKGKEVVVWHPGFAPDLNAVRMCWGENEAGATINKDARYIDTNGFYMDWMSSQGGVLQTFFQQPCEVANGDEKALGSVMCIWTDGALSSEKRLLEQYPFYPCMLTFAERLWRGAKEKRRDLMAQFPARGSAAWEAIAEFENRLTYHRDYYFKHIPFSYVKQADISWNIVGPFDHKGMNDVSFEPENCIKDSYIAGDSILRWSEEPIWGGEVQIRNLYTMFNMHRNQYRQNHWPTGMSSKVGIDDGTCYAITYIKSPVKQDVYLMFGLNGMWGHSGGYRSSRAPEQGSWDFSGGKIWLNDDEITPPYWPFESLPWTRWGEGRIEVPLTEEGYFFRAPVRITLKEGVNKLLVKSVFGHWKGDNGERKWQFCCIPVLWDGLHYTEVPGLEFPNNGIK